ncbi:MAG: hypothetical protein V1742_11350 [Pseudomonadota bacterium]
MTFVIEINLEPIPFSSEAGTAPAGSTGVAPPKLTAGLVSS